MFSEQWADSQIGKPVRVMPGDHGVSRVFRHTLPAPGHKRSTLHPPTQPVFQAVCISGQGGRPIPERPTPYTQWHLRVPPHAQYDQTHSPRRTLGQGSLERLRVSPHRRAARAQVATEGYWSGERSEDELLETARDAACRELEAAARRGHRPDPVERLLLLRPGARHDRAGRRGPERYGWDGPATSTSTPTSRWRAAARPAASTSRRWR